MTLRRYDLNLLPILDALLRHKNLTWAGRELGLTQPAVSHALHRIRALFNDPLLTQQKRKLLLTARGEKLMRSLGEILAEIDSLLDPKSFDPSNSNRRFRISTADYVAFLILPNLMRRLEREAPKISVQIVSDQVTADPELRIARLRSNQLDISIVPRGNFDAPDLKSENVLIDELAIITSVKRGPPVRKLTKRMFERSRHARVRMEDPRLRTFADLQLLQNQITSDDATLVNSPLLLPFVVGQTGITAIMSRRVAERFKDIAGIILHKPPFSAAHLHLDAFWSKTAEPDPAHTWFRQILFEECKKLS
jgi:LysR family transcriptional regulator, nod-box dependent transcriptional activator